MFYPTTYPLAQNWFGKLSQQLHTWLADLTPPPAHQVQLQAGDCYHLDAGHYRLQVLAGSVWVPNLAIFQAGEQVTLTVDAAGLAIHSYGQQAVVFALRGA